MNAIAFPSSVATGRRARAHKTPLTRSRAVASVVGAAVLAAIGAVPLASMLVDPIAGLVYGAGVENAVGAAMRATSMLVTPVAYLLFLTAVWSVLESRVPNRALASTLRVGAFGLVPFIGLVAGAVVWTSGPREMLMMVAAVTVPVGAIATAWAISRRWHFV